MLSVLKVEFEKLFRTKSFWIVLAFLSLITSAVAVTRSVSLAGSVGGVNPAVPKADNGYYFEDNSPYAISLYNVWIGSENTGVLLPEYETDPIVLLLSF